MVKNIKLTLNGKQLTIDSGTPVFELLPKAPHRGTFPPLGAIVNNRIDGLYCRPKSPANIETVDISSRHGMDIYRRTASAILYAAVNEISPDTRVIVGQSISDGYFFEIHGHVMDKDFLALLEKHMRQIIDSDMRLEPEWTSVDEAMEIFKKHGAPDKVKLLGQLRRSEIPLISLKGYRAYAHGPVACRTGLIDRFRLSLYEHGIVLNFPDENGNVLDRVPPQPKLFAAYLETKRWNELIEIHNVADLNEHCMGRTAGDLVKVAEALHEKKIAAIADEIASRKNTRLVLIAGPSASGKTIFSKRLSIHLKIHGLEPVTISMDNYYVDRDATPRHLDGSYNFECVEALDVELLNDHFKKLLKGKCVEIPYYSFPLGKRDPSRTKAMQLGKGQILIVEGIHCLNEALTREVPHQNKFKIYTSALTQLCLDDHNRIFTSDTRLCRRMVRDRLFRGTTAAQTIEGWGSVRAGEKKHIFPFQEDADVIFNSALSYEHSLLKPYAERFLAEVPRDDPSFMEASRLARFFSFFIPILAVEVPRSSILREFIGGSAFSYS